jgi:hypothetical protein
MVLQVLKLAPFDGISSAAQQRKAMNAVRIWVSP